MKALFISPPATSYIETRAEHERPLETSLPRIPFDVCGRLDDSVDLEILELEWELDQHRDDYRRLIADSLRRRQPDVVLTSMYAQSVADVVDQLTSAVREEDPTLPIIVGGQAIPHLGQAVFQVCPNVDVACTDAGSLQSAIRHATGPKAAPAFFGPSKGRGRLLQLPADRVYGSFPIARYVDFYRSRDIEVSAYLENTRGCPYHCTFCAVPRLVEDRDVSATVEEARFLLRQGIRSFYLTDLTFGLNRRKTRSLLSALRGLRREFRQFRFRCITRVDMIDAEMCELLLQAGCWEVALGVETASTAALQAVQKGTTREENVKAVHETARAGLAVRLFLMLGLPGEDIDDLFGFLAEASTVAGELLLQPSLRRDIVGPAFQNRLRSGHLGRGTMHQLDFRTDGRRFGIDAVEEIVNFIVLALAWPSTEVSTTGDRRLQERLTRARGSITVHAGVRGHCVPRRRSDLILIDLADRKVIYAPRGVSVKIRECLMEASDDFFELLAVADGSRPVEQIGEMLAAKFRRGRHYRTRREAGQRTREMIDHLVGEGLVSYNCDS